MCLVSPNNPAAKLGNLPADGNLAVGSRNITSGKLTRNASHANDGDTNPPLEQRGRSPIISRLIFYSQTLTGGVISSLVGARQPPRP